eukprot:6608698-Prymnesium_polylepis.1
MEAHQPPLLLRVALRESVKEDTAPYAAALAPRSPRFADARAARTGGAVARAIGGGADVRVRAGIVAHAHGGRRAFSGCSLGVVWWSCAVATRGDATPKTLATGTDATWSF